MDLVARFRDDVPVPVTVRWPRPAVEVGAALRAALADEHLAIVPGGQQIVYRLRGTVTGRDVSLQVSAAGMHMGAWPSYRVTGTIVDTPSGSELQGGMFVPGVASGTWVLVLVALGVMSVLAIVAAFAWGAVMGALGFAFVLFSPDIRRHLLRGRARDVEVILTSLAGKEAQG